VRTSPNGLIELPRHLWVSRGFYWSIPTHEWVLIVFAGLCAMLFFEDILSPGTAISVSIEFIMPGVNFDARQST